MMQKATAIPLPSRTGEKLCISGGKLLHELDEDKNLARYYVLGNDENLRIRFGKKDKGEH